MRVTRTFSSVLKAGITFFFASAALSIATISAHNAVGVESRTLAFPARAFVSSPSAGTDKPVSIEWGDSDSGLRVVCFNVANTSEPRADRPAWPRITAAGFELPGKLSGFSLMSPLDGDWELVEGERVSLSGKTVTLDVAIVARANPRVKARRRKDLFGIPPGQKGIRGSGTRFCLSGPFPKQLTAAEDTTIEQIINGVVIGFNGVDGTRHGDDLAVWDSADRLIPLFPPVK